MYKYFCAICDHYGMFFWLRISAVNNKSKSKKKLLNKTNDFFLQMKEKMAKKNNE